MKNGAPRVVSIVTLNGYDESGLLALAASLARGLEAPIAAAVLASAAERGVPLADLDRFHDTTCIGVAATVAGRSVVLGTSALFAQLGLPLDGLGEWQQRLRTQRQQVLFVAVDGRPAGFLGVIGTEL